jgi:hypothetical protein
MRLIAVRHLSPACRWTLIASPRRGGFSTPSTKGLERRLAAPRRPDPRYSLHQAHNPGTNSAENILARAFISRSIRVFPVNLSHEGTNRAVMLKSSPHSPNCPGWRQAGYHELFWAFMATHSARERCRGPPKQCGLTRLAALRRVAFPSATSDSITRNSFCDTAIPATRSRLGGDSRRSWRLSRAAWVEGYRVTGAR